MRRFFLWCCAVMLLLNAAEGQFLRSVSMGGALYGLRDTEQGLGLYTFGGNPASLVRDRLIDRLVITPAAGAQWGDYRRTYDPRRVNTFGVTFDGIRTLGEKGTFRGTTTYEIEKRYDVYRSIKRTPYQGEAFFVTDTTTGDFTYNGPAVTFAYAYELFPGVLVGADMHYRVLDGLKGIYSLAKVLYRDVGGTAGLAWEIDPALTLGLTFRPSDTQERIEAKSDDLLDVELFSFRGETHATKKRSGTVEHRVRTMGEEYGLQSFWRPAEELDVAFTSAYGKRQNRDIITSSTEKEIETSHMQEEIYGANLQVRWFLSNELTFGAFAGFRSERQWTSYPAEELLIWDMHGEETRIGAGIAYQIVPEGPAVAVDFDVQFGFADSAKFIDNKNRSVRVQGGVLRVGVEQEISAGVLVRGGFTRGRVDHDLVYWGNDVSSQIVTAGMQLRLTGSLTAEWALSYRVWRAGERASRSSLSALLVLQLLSF